MRAIGAILTVIAGGLGVLNMFGGIISGLWLAFTGQWWAIGWGVAGLFFSHFLLGIILLPGGLLAAPGAMLMEKRPVLAWPFLVLGDLYTSAALCIWCLEVLAFFTSQPGATTAAPVALLLWTFGVATGPIAYMASKEEQAGSSPASVI